MYIYFIKECICRCTDAVVCLLRSFRDENETYFGLILNCPEGTLHYITFKNVF